MLTHICIFVVGVIVGAGIMCLLFMAREEEVENETNKPTTPLV